MLDWLTGKKRTPGLPEYSALRAVPTRGLPPALAADEKSERFAEDRERIENELGTPGPPVSAPLFIELLGSKPGAFLTITLPDDGGRCLPVFSAPVRAGDYVRTLLPSGLSVRYLSSSPLELIRMLRDVETAGIETLTLDRCPRCSIFNGIATASMKTPEDLVAIWCISKATELARCNLYHAFALQAARAGEIETAREVAFETIGHVTPEDPRLHLLLGQIAVRLRDRELLRQATAFLTFLKAERWEQKLNEAVQSGLTDFEEPPQST